MDIASEILDVIEIIVNQKIRENTAQIYPGVCKSVSGNTCVMSINGRNNIVQFYGSTPTVGSTYRVFVPNGNMSMAFIITGTQNESGGSVTPSVASYKDLTDLPSINGITLQEGATSKTLGLYGTGNEPNYPVTKVNGKTGEITLTADDVGALPLNTTIPKKTSELTNDSGFITLAQVPAAPVQSVNGQTGEVVIDEYSLPIASKTVLGGMKVGSGLTINSDGVLSATGSGEVNQNAWSNITVPTQSTNVTSEVAGESSAVTIAANAKTDTFTIASGDAWTKVDADATNKKITLGHKFSGVTNGTYGDATHVAKVTVDKAGHVTGAESVEIVGAKYITGLASDAQTQLNAKVPNTRTVNGKALSSNITLSAGDVGADPSGSASAVLGASSDTSDKNTVYGVKALAQSALNAANAAKTSADGKVASVSAGNNGISVGGTATAPTVGLKISSGSGNLAQIASDGLKVVAPEYSITKDATAQSGFLATYHLTKGGVEVGTAINIPKDYLVKSAEVKVATGSDASGFPAGTTYIDFVVNTYDTTSGSGTESHIYLNVETLVKTHTAGNGISISDTNVISAKVVTANGLSVDSNGIKMAVASTSANGAMTSSMVTKLNGIDTGATANTITLNGSKTKTPSFYAPTGAGTSGQILVSSGSGAPTWKNAPESFHKYTATNGSLTASGGAFTWSIPATTHKVSNVGIIVQLYQVSTGEMVFADVTVNQSNYNVTITINDTASAGTLASGTYRVVIFG